MRAGLPIVFVSVFLALAGCDSGEERRTPVELPASIERCVEAEIDEDMRESKALIECYAALGKPLDECERGVALEATPPIDGQEASPVVAFIGGGRPCVLTRSDAE